MADEIREYIRAAQQAEMRGELNEAVSHLLKAASLYRSRGSTARALQMLRHARKLDTSRQDIADEISRLEWLPERPLHRAVVEDDQDSAVEPSEELKSELEKLLQPTEEPAPLPGANKQMFDRGPTKADPTLNAWCSFCCRPKKEVGELVAGPAGAFICGGCLFESARLLAVPLARAFAGEEEVTQPNHQLAAALASASSAAAPAPAPSPRVPPETEAIAPAAMAAVAKATASVRKVRHARPLVPFFGQAAAARAVEQSLLRGARLVLIVGPEGTGKSAYLADLENRGIGQRGSTQDGENLLLLDGFDKLTATERELFAERFEEEPGLRAVLSVRAEGPAEPLSLLSDEGSFVLHPTANILSTLGQVVPPALADQVDLVAIFEPLSDAELKELAQKLLEKRAAELDLHEEVIAQLVGVAARSGRGGRELEALIRRIPPGSWTLAPGAAPAAAKPKRQRKKSTT